MGRVRRWLRGRLEKASGLFYEGPEPPARYGERVTLFRARQGDEDWSTFATELAESAYREGYVRGLEHSTRAVGSAFGAFDKEADERRHGWSLAAQSPRLADVLRTLSEAGPLATLPDERARLAALAAQGAHDGSFQVVLLDGDERTHPVKVPHG